MFISTYLKAIMKNPGNGEKKKIDFWYMSFVTMGIELEFRSKKF